MFPSPTELHYFLEVTRTLNVSRAAERLGISQPTLSLAVQRLETSLGTPLLIRSKSGVQLTHAGHRLAGQAQALLQQWERLRAETKRSETELAGTYTIGCHPSVALYSLPQVLPKLLASHPALEIQLSHDLSRKITEDVISFKIDFGIVVNPWPHPDLVIRPLCEDTVGLWTSHDPSPLQRVGGKEAVLIVEPDLMQTQALLKQLEQAGVTFSRLLRSGNLEVIAALVAAKAGVGILPSRVATRVPAYGLKALGKPYPTFADKIALIYRADAQNTRASKALAQSIDRLFREN